MKIVVLDELVKLLRNYSVDCLVESLISVNLLYQRRRNHSFAESFKVSVPLVSGKPLLLLLSIILRLKGNSQFDVKIIDLIFNYFHDYSKFKINYSFFADKPPFHDKSEKGMISRSLSPC